MAGRYGKRQEKVDVLQNMCKWQDKLDVLIKMCESRRKMRYMVVNVRCVAKYGAWQENLTINRNTRASAKYGKWQEYMTICRITKRSSILYGKRQENTARRRKLLRISAYRKVTG